MTGDADVPPTWRPQRTETPEERLSLYRSQGVAFGVLLLPWDLLSPVQRDAALLLARQEGRGLAEVGTFRRDAAHADEAGRGRMIAGLWLMGFMQIPIHPLDAEYWMRLVEAPDRHAGFDPRLEAFREGCEEALGGYDPPPPPGPGCRCPACEKKYPKRRRRRR